MTAIQRSTSQQALLEAKIAMRLAADTLGAIAQERPGLWFTELASRLRKACNALDLQDIQQLSPSYAGLERPSCPSCGWSERGD